MTNYAVSQQRIAIGAESTPGTAPSSLVTLHQVEFSAPAIERRQDARPGVTSDYLPARGFNAGRRATISISTPLWIADGTPTGNLVGNSLYPLFQACDFATRADSGDSMTATTALSWLPGAANSVTVDYSDGVRTLRMTGCKGTFTIAATPGQELRVTFDLTGNLDTDSRLLGAAATRPAASSVPAIEPAVMRGGAVSIAGANIDTINSLTFTQSANIAHPEDITAAAGYALPRITSAAMSAAVSFLKSQSTPDGLTAPSFANTSAAFSAEFSNAAGNGSLAFSLQGTIMDLQHTNNGELAGQDVTVMARSGATPLPTLTFMADK